MWENSLLLIDGFFIGFMLTLMAVALYLHYRLKDRFFLLFALFLLAFAFSFDNNIIMRQYSFLAGTLAAFFYFVAIDDMTGFSRTSRVQFDRIWAGYILVYIGVQVFLTNSEITYKYHLQRHFLLSLWLPGLLFCYEILKHKKDNPYRLLGLGIVFMLLGLLFNYHILGKDVIDMPVYLGAFSSILLTFGARLTWHEYRDFAGVDMERGAVPDLSTPPFVQKLNAVVAANYQDEEFGTPELAKAMGVARMTLHRKMKKIIGKSATDYLRAYRLAKARKLLLADALLTIAEVSQQTGFRTPNYFSQVFKKEFGQSPSVFRKKNKDFRR